MSFLATLQINGQEYNILQCDYTFLQNIDASGNPSGKPKGGKIFLSLESGESLDFFEWMISKDEKKNGTIVFSRRDRLGSMKQLEFTEAYCIYYKEKFSSSGITPMHIELELAAKTITIGNAVYENPRPA